MRKPSRIIRRAFEVAAQLGNPPSVCRECYIHPAVFEGYVAGSLRMTATLEDLDEFPAGYGRLSGRSYAF